MWGMEIDRDGERGGFKKTKSLPTGFSLMMASALVLAAADMAGEETLDVGKKRRRNEMVGEGASDVGSLGVMRLRCDAMELAVINFC